MSEGPLSVSVSVAVALAVHLAAMAVNIVMCVRTLGT